MLMRSKLVYEEREFIMDSSFSFRKYAFNTSDMRAELNGSILSCRLPQALHWPLEARA